MIEVKNLSKSFTVYKKDPGLLGSIKSLVNRQAIEKEAVKSVSFNVGEGEIVGLIGANGAGKTTLVKMLAGIIFPSSGTASVLGYVPWERNNQLRRQIALIMGQKAQLWWDLPAADCFLLLKEIYQIEEEQFSETINYLSDILNVKHVLNIQIRRLSLGERMAMELIATLLHSPRVVYMDEPTIGLDINAQHSIREFILHYREQHQPAMILTSHYMGDIEALCKRIIIIKEGQFVYDGSLQAIKDNYSSHKVLTLQLNDHCPDDKQRASLNKMGKLIKYEDNIIQIQVNRNASAEVAGHLLNQYPVHDLSIEDIDISTIIAKILSKKED